MISLGIDIGGTGCKCVAFCHDGTQLALSYEEYPVPAGQVNLPPEILTQSVFRVIAQCAAALDHNEEIAAVTVSSFGESFVAVDAEGQPLTDILMYFGSTESREFSELVQQVGEKRFMEIARIPPDASYSLSKMLYTKKAAERPVWKYLFIAGFLCWKLSGRVCTDESLACRSLLYDVKAHRWSGELLEACGIEEDTLPEVVPAGTCLGAVLPELAVQLGLPEGVQVVMGCHDQIVNALGAGVEEIGDAVDTSGTCECITPLFDAVPESMAFQRHNFACVPYLGKGGYVTYAYNISAGSVVRWYRDALALHLEEEAKVAGKSIYDLLNETCPAEPSSLMVLPFLQGMGGTPEVDAGATGLIAGLTTRTRLPEIYRAILEGVTFEMRYNQEKLAEHGIRFHRLYACGGGARSAVWLQIKADVLGCELLPVQTEETGAMGSAILGFAAVTGEEPFAIARRMRAYGDAVTPDPHRQAIYEQRYEAYKALRSLYKSRHM